MILNIVLIDEPKKRNIRNETDIHFMLRFRVFIFTFGRFFALVYKTYYSDVVKINLICECITV